MTPNEITTVIASGLELKLDIPFRLQLMERVKVWRSRLIANSVQKVQQQRKFFKQTLYMPMTTKSVVCNFPIGCPVSVTVDNLPALVRVGNQLFDYIGTVDGSKPFRELQPGESSYLKYGRFSKEFDAYELVNSKVVVNREGLPFIRVDAIFDDPMAVLKYNCNCAGEVAGKCDEWDVEFPVSGDILQLIIQSIVEIDYRRRQPTPTDEIPVTK